MKKNEHHGRRRELPHIHSGMSLREAKKAICSMGGGFGPRNGTGEVDFWHPLLRSLSAVDNRRKDCERRLVVWLKRVRDLCAGDDRRGGPTK